MIALGGLTMNNAHSEIGSCLRTDARSPEKKESYLPMAKAGEITRIFHVFLCFKKPFVNLILRLNRIKHLSFRYPDHSERSVAVGVSHHRI